MLKLIALKIYKDCARHIYKCLQPDVYYYFCNEFVFDRIGTLSYRNSNLHALPSDFYTNLDETTDKSIVNDIEINISAIVGKNGDGKSSIVELIIRLINNLAESSGIYEAPLQHVLGLRAELVYQSGDTIYKIIESSEQGAYLVKYATLSIDRRIVRSLSRVYLSKENPMPELFYTWVSNYSHYAYNVYDFQKEWSKDPATVSDAKGANEACWLHHIFHKNDGYSIPIVLHPCRESGNVEINKESALSKQRLIALFINSVEAQGSFRNITGNKAVALKLSPLKYSKLQKRTLEEYLMSVRFDNTNLDWAQRSIQALQRVVHGQPDGPMVGLSKEEYKIACDVLDVLLGVKSDVVNSGVNYPYVEYLEQMDNYIKHNIPECFSKTRYKNYARKKSDITQFLNSLKSLRVRYDQNEGKRDLSNYQEPPVVREAYIKYQDYNVAQIARIYLIYQIAVHYKINPLIVCKPFEELNDVERCQHYIIYKTISIFKTYPAYKELLEKKKFPWEACFEYSENELKNLMQLLRSDRNNNSHITRKLTQTWNFITGNKGVDLYKKLAKEEENPILYQSNDGEIVLRLDTVKSHYKSGKILLTELPPPIYETDILFERGKNYVEMSTLSSGEKQVLNIIGAIIYHLHNIDSGRYYQSVNIILEEIELYFHPDYQRQFVFRLIRQIKGEMFPYLKAVNVLFVTHSPFVLSDVPKENVLFLNNGAPDTQMQENTFGANIHSLLKNGFFLPNLTMGEFAYHKINRLFAKLNANDVKAGEIADMNKEITLVGEPYLREQLFKKFYSLPQVKQYFEDLVKK